MGDGGAPVATGAVSANSGGVGPSGSGGSNVGGGPSTSPTGGGSEGVGGSGEATASGGLAAGSGGLVGAGGAINGDGGQSACNTTEVELSVTRLATTRIADLGVPFDFDEQDLVGPEDWASQYGRAPQIVPHSSGSQLDILFQDQASGEYAYVVRVRPSSAGYMVDAAFRVESLGKIMGLTKDPEGNYYVASCVDEEARIDASYPPNGVFRSSVVRVVKFGEDGCVSMESDVDVERGRTDTNAEIIVNPMVASTSRLVWGGGRLLLIHGNNTEPDPQIDGARHQKAIATHIDAADGHVLRTSTMWVSHSFDQRALFDGQAFVELHLGDAYPRSVTIGRYFDGIGAGGHTVFAIKGDEGANNTFTRLGSILKGADEEFPYLTLFSTERTTTADGDALVQGTRDLAFVRVQSDFQKQPEQAVIVEQTGNVSVQEVTSAGASVTNRVHWLTELEEGAHAERPRMAALPSGDIIVLFEKYTGPEYVGTYALRIDERGSALAGPTELPGKHHLSRGDDIVAVEDRVVFVTGGGGALHINWVAADLTAERTTLP